MILHVVGSSVEPTTYNHLPDRAVKSTVNDEGKYPQQVPNFRLNYKID